jgi:hypothetical protein
VAAGAKNFISADKSFQTEGLQRGGQMVQLDAAPKALLVTRALLDDCAGTAFGRGDDGRKKKGWLSRETQPPHESQSEIPNPNQFSNPKTQTPFSILYQAMAAS